MRRSVQAFDGCYEAARAAALSGVPKSTVYYWARTGLVVPSVSPVREKLWSYADLMSLRIVSWLRHPKDVVPASPMPEVRRALARLDELELDIWQRGEADRSPLFVDRQGKIILVGEDIAADAYGQGVLAECLDLLGPFESVDARGPDLRHPRPHLRIVPGKCAGEPHLAGSRLTTLSIKALVDRGFDDDALSRLYPEEDPVALHEAMELEQELAGEVVAA